MKRIAIALFGLALGLGACGGGSDDASDAPTDDTNADGQTDDTDGTGETSRGSDIDICALISAAEVEGVLGEPATSVDNSTGDLRDCAWEGNGDALNVLSVSVYVHPDAATAEEQYGLTGGGIEGVDILGLGDEASYNETFGLQVLSGRYDISVDNTGPDEKASDLAIAQLLIDRLP